MHQSDRILDKSITLIRHGYASDGAVDQLRSLNDQGKIQAKQRGLYLKKEEPFDLLVTSSAVRAKETAKIIIDELNISSPLVEIDELYQPLKLDDRKRVNDLLETLGACSLTNYKQYDAENAWSRYTKDAFERLCFEIARCSARKILVVAHGNIINSLGLEFYHDFDELNEIYFDYCEGFEINNRGITVMDHDRD